MNSCYPFVNTPLPYAYDALEPYIDEETMRLHHDRHLQTYIDNLNAFLEENPSLQKFSLEELLSMWRRLPCHLQAPLRHNAGGVFQSPLLLRQHEAAGHALLFSQLLSPTLNGQYNFPASIRSFSVILCFCSFSMNSFRYGTFSQDLLNLLQFLLRKLQILDRLHIIKHLLGSRCSHQHACHDPVTQHPAQSHLRERLSPACGNAVQAPGSAAAFLLSEPLP